MVNLNLSAGYSIVGQNTYETHEYSLCADNLCEGLWE
jgi:hypothetical protein